MFYILTSIFGRIRGYYMLVKLRAKCVRGFLVQLFERACYIFIYTVYHNAIWEKISGIAIKVETLQEKHKENIISSVVKIQIIAND